MAAIIRWVWKQKSFGEFRRWHTTHILIALVFGILLAISYMQLMQSRPLPSVYAHLAPWFDIDNKTEESSDDIASDISYDNAISAVFPLIAKPSDIHLSKQKKYYREQKEKPDWVLNTRVLFGGSEPTGTGWPPELFRLQLWYIPQMNCPTNVRVGMVSDIGSDAYVMCNPWVLAEYKDPCIVYSVGTGGLVQFEENLFDLTGHRCEFYCFDERHEANLTIFEKFNGKFLHAKVSAKSQPAKRIYSLLDITRKNGHTKIDVLKIDVEGREFSILPPFLRQFNGTICHLLLEVHANENSDMKMWARLFRMLERRGFRLYGKEQFSFDPRCIQYSYLHLSCFDRYQVKPEAVVFRYFA